MEITLYNKNEQNSLEPIKNALNTPLVNDLADNILKTKLLLVFRDAHRITGFKLSENNQDLHSTADETIVELRRSKTNIRIDEIDIAIRNGCHQKYGEYMGLSSVTYCKFIKAYVTEENRLEAIRLKNEPEPSRTPSEQEIFDLSKGNAIKAFKELHQCGTVGRFGEVVYDFLSKVKILDLSQEEKNEYWKQAKNEFQSHLEKGIANPVDVSERRRLTLELELFMQGGKKEKLTTISKRLIVDDFYRQLIMEETDINTIFN